MLIVGIYIPNPRLDHHIYIQWSVDNFSTFDFDVTFLLFCALLLVEGYFFYYSWGWFVAKAFGGLGVTAGLAADRTAMTSLVTGQQFFETDTKKMFVYSGSAWVQVNDYTLAAIGVDSGGRVTKPFQPICQLYNQTGRNPDAAMGWTGTYVNVGSMWDGSTRVTVPVAGTYLATYEGMSWNDIAGGSYMMDLFKNGSWISTARQYTNAPSQHQHISMHVYISCGANDFFQWVPRGIRAYSDSSGYQHASVALVA